MSPFFNNQTPPDQSATGTGDPGQGQQGDFGNGSGNVLPVKEKVADSIPYEVLGYVPEDAARHYSFVPLSVVDGVLEVGIVDPKNIEARDAISFIATKHNIPFKLFQISEDNFNKVLEGYKSISGQVSRALTELDDEETGDRNKAEVELEKTLATKVKVDIIEEAPVSKIVAVVIQHAAEGNASDIHIEPLREKVRVRFRVDGVLHTSLFLPLAVHEAVVARVKILANIKLDEKRKPQDGRFSAKLEGRQVDFRVSTMPSFFGEKAVIRILDPEKGNRKLDNIGLSAAHLKTFRAAIERPYGMILVTGPTGSGKSTTLYSMLAELDREGKNIVSLEDPIEYNLEGVNQSQVRPEIGYTFASGLRSILRQDPDIILVGEIRDKETAELAIQAALTGHLVLSTLHTNTSAGAIPRLVDMGVDPYLIAPTLILSIGQRLVRMMCDGREPLVVDTALRGLFEGESKDLPQQFKPVIPADAKVYRAVPTPTCPGGTRGRIGVFETLVIDHDIQECILKKPVEMEIFAKAREKGMTTLKEDAIQKALAGVIPFEEVNQV